jgi:hypothetical protein
MESSKRGGNSQGRILGIDPGGTTGICKYHGYTRTIYVAQITNGEHHTELNNMLRHWKPDIVVCERFDYRPRQRNANLSAVEYIGVIKLWCQKNYVPLVLQKQIKNTENALWTDAKLSALELYKPGVPHAMDAIRQVLHYVTSTGDNYWVDKYGKTL